MDLVIDVGNTKVKYALFNESKKLIVSKAESHQLFKKQLDHIFEAYPKIQNSIVSASGKVDINWLSLLNKNTNCIEFSHKTAIPIQNQYQTKHSLGVDRIALAVAANFIYPKKNCLIVDLGTCITYDFILQSGVYLGGAISAGIDMRFKAMHNFTEKLPLITMLDRIPQNYIGQTTEESLKIGVFQAVVHEIEGFYNQYIADYKDLTLVLTGGNAQVLAERVKNSIFANSNFQLFGLHQILIYNSNAHKK
ncbi:type III pantothenate kinase [Psychroflexus salis]|uniref:Type III pantothenate kinase n=1 Tax=Psychroflexus salis TaxID=1526574 RepID=A0A916ZUK0_9FLAO|nr:type III pantothenate kinase [Psychroflexus salis]GGE13949.1 type III pantothenate kinase [Psychroflexus salis]